MYSIIVSPYHPDGEKRYHEVYTPEETGELIKRLAEDMNSDQKITIVKTEEKP